MNILLKPLGESYFAEAKQLKSKNKTCMHISPPAAEFFKVFLNHKKGFQLLDASGEYRTYDVKSKSFNKWKDGTWAPSTANEIGVGVVDLREFLGVEDTLLGAKSIPYFYSMLAALEERRSPLFAEVKRWVFICADEGQQLQAMNFVESHGAFNFLHVDFFDYRPGKFERLGDAIVGRATKNVILMFLQDMDAHAHIQIPTDFYPLETPVYTKPHGYNKLEYQVYNTEL